MAEAEIKEIHESETPIVTPYFEIPIVGNFSENDIELVDTKEEYKVPEWAQITIDKTWQASLEEAEKSGEKLFDNPKIYVKKSKLIQGKLRIVIGRTSYKTFAGTYGSEIRSSHPELIPQMLSIATVLETSDGFLLLHKRSGANFAFKNWISTIAGSVELDDMDENGNLNPFQSVLNEISEEAAVNPETIKEIKCLGLTRDRRDGVEDLLFFTRTKLTKQEVQDNQKTKKLVEGSSIFIPARPDELAKKILEFTNIFVSDGASALTLYGREKFGEAWLNYIIKRLNRRGKVYENLPPEQQKILEQRKIERLRKLN